MGEPAKTRGEVIGRALAAVAGDLRDWPERCGWCQSEQVSVTLDGRDHLQCADCRKLTSREVAYQDRCRRAGIQP